MATPLLIAGVLTAVGYNINNNNENKDTTNKPHQNLKSGGNNTKKKFKHIYSNVTEHNECEDYMTNQPFTHNNMQPFYGTNVTQNTHADNMFSSKLATFTGNFKDGEYRPKKEITGLFDKTQTGGNVFGTPTTDLKERYVNPLNKHNDKPFESVNVGSGIGLDYDNPSGGGYQQLDTQLYARPRTIDTLRVKTKQRVSYTTPTIPGTDITTNNRGLKAPITKFKRQKLFKNREQFATSGINNKETYKSPVVLNNNNRKTTDQREHFNAGSNTTRQRVRGGKYSAVSRNVLKNVDTNLNFSNVVKGENNRSGYKKQPITNKEIVSIKSGNEFRNFIGRSINTLKNILFKPRTTHKEQTVSKTYLLNPSGKSKTKSRVNKLLKRTNKETTLGKTYYGGQSAQNKSGYNKVVHSVPTTHKETTSDNVYMGHANSGINNNTKDRTYAHTMKQNVCKEVVSKGRPPKGGGPKTNVSCKNIHMQINRNNLNTEVLGIIPSKQNKIYSEDKINITTYKDGLQKETLCQSVQRVNPDVVGQLNNNPYNIDITSKVKTI